ncbi:MAG: T9SS type A sorting domain-containing protein [Algibacter sp.]
MKKNYSTFVFLCFSFLAFSQTPSASVNFEAADPLNNLPAGITSINPQDFYETPETPGVFSDSIVAFIGNNSHYFIEEGGDLVNAELFTQRNQFDNVVKDVDGNKLLQTDYTGHVIIDETALGTSSYSVRLNLSVFGHRMTSTDCGIFTITGNDGGTYKDDRVTARNGGFTTGFGDNSGIGSTTGGFVYGTATPAYREIVVTYNDTDKLYRMYVEGVERLLSESAQTSGDWTDRKFYIGFNGQNSVKSTGTRHINPTTGAFTSNGVRGDGRTADLQMRMDNIEVYQTALSQANITTLFGGGTLSTNSQTKEIFNTYPNPVKDRLYFSSRNVHSVEIYNILGAKVSSQTITDGADMNNLKSGIYLVKSIDENGLVLDTSKVIKN